MPATPGWTWPRSLPNIPIPIPRFAECELRVPTGKKMRKLLTSMEWLDKPFAQLMPDDINDYIDDRCQDAAPATVDREVDIFFRVCTMAIDTWRIQPSP
jgi:hypothetical protein